MYALVDCNNFYVSCERVFDLSLENRPVAVLSNNDGCVISRSNELKQLGIKMGVPFFQLRPHLKRHNIAIRSSNYELYGDMSRRVMSILGNFSPNVEPYSIDEAFVSINLPHGSSYYSYAQEIRSRLFKWTGLPVGVGIASTKTLAKMANHIGKKTPEGVFVMTSNPTDILRQLPVGEVWGIGKRLTAKLERLGIRTAEQLSACEDGYLRKKFNVCVERTATELRGTPALEAENPDEPSQSVSCSRSFSYPVTAFNELSEAIASYTSLTAEKLRKEKQRASGANVYFQYYPDHGPIEREGGMSGTTVVFDQLTGSTAKMLAKINNILPSIFIKGRRYKKAGVVLYGLEGSHGEQPDLFSAEVEDKNDKLYETIDRINRQFGKKAIFHLGEGTGQPWKMKREHLSPCYTTNWDQLLQVK